MRTTSKLLLTTTPALALGYLLLTGYILNRVRPVPITQIPERVRETRRTPELTPA